MDGNRALEVSQSSEGTAYIKISAADSKFSRSVRIEDLIQDYKGPLVNFDFNQNGNLIGIEVVVLGLDSDE